jgi:hypothetical protein
LESATVPGNGGYFSASALICFKNTRSSSSCNFSKAWSTLALPLFPCLVVPVGGWVMPQLQKYLKSARPLLSPRNQTDLIFVSKNGRRITNCNLNDLIRKYARRSGLEHRITPQSFRHACDTIRAWCDFLRHACATNMLQNGAGAVYRDEL